MNWAKLASGYTITPRNLRILAKGLNPWAPFRVTLYPPLRVRPKAYRKEPPHHG